MRKRMTVLLTILVVVSLLSATVQASSWPQHARDESNNAIIEAPTPLSDEEASLVFDLALRDAESHDAVSNILLLDDYLLVACGSELMKIDREGQIVENAQLDNPISSFTPYITSGDGAVYLYLHDGVAGRVQAFDADSLEPLWHSSKMEGMESFSPLLFADSWLYVPLSGYDYSEYTVLPGAVLGFDLREVAEQQTVEPDFIYRDEVSSFYWNGAATAGELLYIGSVQGELLAIDRQEGRLESKIQAADSIKSSLSLHDERIYFGTDRGAGAVDLAQDGAFLPDTLQTVDLGAQVTTTPAVYQNRVYVGSGDFSGGTGFHVLDAKPLMPVYAVETAGIDSWSDEEIAVAGIQSSPVVATGHGDDIAVYYTLNAKPSSLIRLLDRAGAQTGEQAALFVPAAAQQNAAMTALAAGSDGTLYYANDAGILFAVAGAGDAAGTFLSWDQPVLWGLMLLLLILIVGYAVHRQRKKDTSEEA